MSERCDYHWHYEKRDGAIVCQECGDPVANNSRYRDLGSEHFISPTLHARGCSLVGTGGFLIMHFKPDGGMCEGALSTCPAQCGQGRHWTADVSGGPEFVTLSPSVLCSCGDHGFVRLGRWVAA